MSCSKKQNSGQLDTNILYMCSNTEGIEWQAMELGEDGHESGLTKTESKEQKL